MQSEVIKIDHFTMDFGNGDGVFDLSLTINKGEMVGLVGTNGAGKTTTMRTIMGFLKPDKGKVTINGKDSWKDAYEIKKAIGYVPGSIAFPPVATGTVFLKIQSDFWGIKDDTYTNQLIDLFKFDAGADLKRMSKGMKQKTAIVAAFMPKPDILILDEPTTGLDPVMRDAAIGLIQEQKRQGKTVFMSSHMFDELEQTCDRVAFIKEGKLIDLVSMADISGHKEREYRIGFESETDMQTFMAKGYKVITSNPAATHLNIGILDSQINKLFADLSELTLRYIQYVPYNLEKYFNDNFVNTKRKEDNLYV